MAHYQTGQRQRALAAASGKAPGGTFPDPPCPRPCRTRCALCAPARRYGAHGSRKNFAAARRAGYRLHAPIKANDSGRSNGTEGWHKEDARQLAGARGAAARGVDVSRIPRRKKLASREDWKGEVGQSVRPGAEYVFSAFKRLFGGHVVARKWENVVKEVARKIAIYNAILEAAGGA